MEAKVKAIQDYPRPSKKKNLRAFLSLSNYYRRFVPGYGSMAVPLTEATRKTEPDKISWDKASENAFQQIKDALVRDPVLKSPEEDKLFILQTNTSGIEIGGVLSQKGECLKEQGNNHHQRNPENVG